MIAELLLAAAIAVSPCEPVSPTCARWQMEFVQKQTGEAFHIYWGWYTDNEANLDMWYELDVAELKPGIDPQTQTPILHARIAEGTHQFDWIPRKVGVYYVRVRACDPTGCSRWTVSVDPAHTDPTESPRGFAMIVRLAPPSGGGI